MVVHTARMERAEAITLFWSRGGESEEEQGRMLSRGGVGRNRGSLRGRVVHSELS